MIQIADSAGSPSADAAAPLETNAAGAADTAVEGHAQPLFSVCIPCFNHGEYVGKTIESVLRQSFQDFEIIVVDNCSTDGSWEVVSAYSDPRIRLYRNRYNIGFAPNLQRVTQYARGKFVNLLSSDDLMAPDALQTYADLIAEHAADADRLVLMSDAVQIDGSGRPNRYITHAPGSLVPQRVDALPEELADTVDVIAGRDAFAAAMRELNTAGTFCTVTVSRALWDAVEGYNSVQRINPDKHFILKVLRRNPRVLYVHRPLYQYRRHEGGQGAQQKRERSLKFPCDQYGYLLSFPDDWLEAAGVTREQQRRVFVDRDCVRSAAAELSRGRWLYATRLLAFAWATFPGTAARSLRWWSLLALLLSGPIGIGLLAGVRTATRRAGRNRRDALQSEAAAGEAGCLGEHVPL